MTTDYNELFATGWGEYTPEVLAPAGHWVLEATSLVYMAPKSEGKSPRIGIFYKPVLAQGDVNKAELKSLNGNTNFSDASSWFFYGSNKDKEKLAKHLEAHYGFELDKSVELTVVDDNGARKINPEVRNALRGAKIVGKVTIGTFNNEQSSEIQSFLPYEG